MVIKCIAVYLLIGFVLTLIFSLLTRPPRQPRSRSDFDRSIQGRWGRIRGRRQ